MSLEFVRNRLIVDGRAVARFPDRVQTALYVPENDTIAVITDSGRYGHRNVWAYHGDGRPRWRVAPSGADRKAGYDAYFFLGVYDATYFLAYTRKGLVAIHAGSGHATPVRYRLPW
jgi:hypothetical protein